MTWKHLHYFFEDVSPIKFFAVTAAIFGVIFLLITPPFQTPDEPVHFYRAYQISQGHLLLEQRGSVAGGFLPRSLEQTVTYTTRQPTLQFQPTVKYNIHKTRAALSIKEAGDKKELYDLSATANYSPISYLPQSIGIVIARIIRQSPVVMMYAARLFNLAMWILLISLAIRFMPYKKWALAAVGLIPMMIFDAVSLGADVMMYGLVALVLALILKFSNDKKKLESKNIILLAALLAALMITKQGAFIFLLLVLLIPGILLGRKKSAVCKRALLVVVPLAVLGFWMLLIAHLNLSISSDFHPNPPEQLKFIIERPLGYLNVLFRTFFFTTSDGMARSFIGNFGWVDAPLAEYFADLGYIGLAFLMVASYTKRNLTVPKKDMLILSATGFLYWVAIATALYIYYDPLRYKTIIGIQGRYFIPLAILAIPLLSRFGTSVKTSKLFYKQIAVTLPIFLLVASVITIYFRYYITF